LNEKYRLKIIRIIIMIIISINIYTTDLQEIHALNYNHSIFLFFIFLFFFLINLRDTYIFNMVLSYKYKRNKSDMLKSIRKMNKKINKMNKKE
jgi:type III secretory pathway component EscU